MSYPERLDQLLLERAKYGKTGSNLLEPIFHSQVP